MIADGLARSGASEMSAALRQSTLNLIAANGFSEYFDPRDGRGLGGTDFSWTAAIYLLLR
jgi:hypothetical protein